MNLFSQLTGMYGVTIMDPKKIAGIDTGVTPAQFVMHNAFGIFEVSREEFNRMCADPGYYKMDDFNVAHRGQTPQDTKYTQRVNALPSAIIAQEIASTLEEDEAFAAMEALDTNHQMAHAPNTQNPLVIYHGNCADGFSAAWVFWHVQKFIPMTFDFHAGVYGEEPPNVADRDVFLVDFSYSRQVIKDMIQIGGAFHVTIIDHHKTAVENLTGLDDELAEDAHIAAMEISGHDNGERDLQLTLMFNMEQSGATLAWDYWDEVWHANGIHRPVLLGHVEDRDLWRFKLPLTREIQASVFSYEYTFENWDRLMLHTNMLVLAEGGAAIERKHHKDIAELVKVCMRHLEIGGHLVPVASLPYTLTSDAGALMAKSFKNGTSFAACYWDTPDSRVFSLRSVEGIGLDVSLVAKLYGGGGHKHASGFKVSREHPLAMA